MSIDPDEFVLLVEEALDDIPEPFATALREVAVVVEEEDADDPDLYGLYLGAPLTEPEARLGHPPPRIAVYMRPLMQHFPQRDDLVEEIRVTVLHELGHHLGLDEDRLEELGYG